MCCVKTYIECVSAGKIPLPPHTPLTARIADAANIMLCKPTQILHRRILHAPMTEEPVLDGPIPSLSNHKVAEVLNKMKHRKATGSNEITTDAWKIIDNTGIFILMTLFNDIIIKACIHRE